jgi:hypothetical protein
MRLATIRIVAFAARLNSHPIDEDLPMGTPVKPCPFKTPNYFAASLASLAFRREGCTHQATPMPIR